MTPLSLSQELYDLHVSDLLTRWQTMDAQEVLEAITRLARYAWHSHVGYLRDPRLELLLKRLAIQSPVSIEAHTNSDSSSLKILFIATTVHYVGGHTKMMQNWIAADTRHDYHIAITNQKAETAEIFDLDPAHIFLCNHASTFLERAASLRSHVSNGEFDLIMLFQHPDDVVPSLALENYDIPVLYYNHADHVYWLGGSVSNIVIDFRETGVSNTREYRKLSSRILPYILDPQDKFLPASDKAKLRQELSIPYDKVLVSMASYYKFAPVGEVDFFDTLITFLKANPAVGAYIIGVSTKQITEEFGKKELPTNLHLLGNLKDPSAYLQLSDIFLEPFPMSTGLGMCEAVRTGLVPLFSYHDNLTIYIEGVRSLFDMHHKPRPANREAYYQELLELLEGKQLFAERLQEFQDFIRRATVPAWNESVYALYDELIKSPEPISLPDTPIHRALADDERFCNFRNNADPREVLEKFIRITRKPLSREMQDLVYTRWKKLAWSHFSLKGRAAFKGYVYH